MTWTIDHDVEHACCWSVAIKDSKNNLIAECEKEYAAIICSAPELLEKLKLAKDYLETFGVYLEHLGYVLPKGLDINKINEVIKYAEREII